MRVVALVWIAITAACGGDGESAATGSPTTCPIPNEARDAGDVPPELHLSDHATVTEVTRRGGALGITAISTKSVVELYPPLARAILDAGYSIVSSDNEGFEAEIFFGDEAVTGAYRLREGPCKDQVTVRLLFEDKGKKTS